MKYFFTELVRVREGLRSKNDTVDDLNDGDHGNDRDSS